MSISEYTKRTLRELGLTDYETEAYLTVLRMGETTASQISRESGIPYSRVYEVLKRLSDKGWVQMQSGKPQRYIPLPPKDAFKAYRMSLFRQLDDSEKEVIQALQPIYDQRGGAERSDVMILHGENNILAKLLDMIDKATDYAFIALPPLPESIWGVLGPWARILRQRNVKIRLLLTEPPPQGLLELLGFAEKRVQSGLYASGMIIDQRETLLALPESDHILEGEPKGRGITLSPAQQRQLRWAIWSAHKGLALIATSYFEHIWNSAKPL